VDGKDHKGFRHKTADHIYQLYGKRLLELHHYI